MPPNNYNRRTIRDALLAERNAQAERNTPTVYAPVARPHIVVRRMETRPIIIVVPKSIRDSYLVWYQQGMTSMLNNQNGMTPDEIECVKQTLHALLALVNGIDVDEPHAPPQPSEQRNTTTLPAPQQETPPQNNGAPMDANALCSSVFGALTTHSPLTLFQIQQRCRPATLAQVSTALTVLIGSHRVEQIGHKYTIMGGQHDHQPQQ